VNIQGGTRDGKPTSSVGTTAGRGGNGTTTVGTTGVGITARNPNSGGSDTGWIAALIGGAALTTAAIAAHEYTREPQELARHGPQMPNEFTMSGFQFKAFTQANWPVGLDFYMDPGGVLTLQIQVDQGPSLAVPYTNRSVGARTFDRFTTPANFPTTPTPATYTITAVNPRTRLPVYLRLFGLAAGPRVVGSIAIDEVHFGPDQIRPREKEEAVFTFHTHTSFDKIQAEFLKALTAQGELTSKLEDTDDLQHIMGESNERKQWNGKKASPGEHMLQLRGWESALDRANWVIAWSNDQVDVDE
jgi:hypothetical protein